MCGVRFDFAGEHRLLKPESLLPEPLGVPAEPRVVEVVRVERGLPDAAFAPETRHPRGGRDARARERHRAPTLDEGVGDVSEWTVVVGGHAVTETCRGQKPCAECPHDDASTCVFSRLTAE